jgi:hypothetical protein
VNLPARLRGLWRWPFVWAVTARVQKAFLSFFSICFDFFELFADLARASSRAGTPTLVHIYSTQRRLFNGASRRTRCQIASVGRRPSASSLPVSTEASRGPPAGVPVSGASAAFILDGDYKPASLSERVFPLTHQPAAGSLRVRSTWTLVREGAFDAPLPPWQRVQVRVSSPGRQDRSNLNLVFKGNVRRVHGAPGIVSARHAYCQCAHRQLRGSSFVRLGLAGVTVSQIRLLMGGFQLGQPMARGLLYVCQPLHFI